MKIICTTSDNYLHLIPVFCYLFNKNWDAEQKVEIVGYQSPDYPLPENFSFYSMGEQRSVNEWSTDLRKYFESISDEWICWLMEDTLIKGVNTDNLNEAFSLMMPNIGRIDLTADIAKRNHIINKLGFVVAAPDTRYRLSTQPSIWNKYFLLQYLTNGLSPWDFETQDSKNDGWGIVGTVSPAIKHNEGVRKTNRFKLDLNGLTDSEQSYIINTCEWLN